MNLKKESAISLISLVVTIIVLLILAGITINLISGSEGIVGRTESAVKKHEEASTLENTILNDYETKIKEYSNDESTEEITINKAQYQQLLQDIEKIKNSNDTQVYMGTVLKNSVDKETEVIVNTYTFPKDGRVLVNGFVEEEIIQTVGLYKVGLKIKEKDSNTYSYLSSNAMYLPSVGWTYIPQSCSEIINVKEGDTIEMYIWFSGKANFTHNELKVTYF